MNEVEMYKIEQFVGKLQWWNERKGKLKAREDTYISKAFFVQPTQDPRYSTPNFRVMMR